MEIYGNTSGLAPSETKALERIYQRRLPFDKLTGVGSKVLAYLLCSDFGAERQNLSTLIEKYRSAACGELVEPKAQQASCVSPRDC